MRGAANRGFTLVEMMVSMAMGSVVLVLAVVSLRSTGDGYSRSTNGVSAEREARAGLTIATEDLAKAVSGQEMVFGGDEDGWPQDKLGFPCLQPEDAQTPDDLEGDLCAVVYYLKDLQVGRDWVRCLMRGFRDSRETYEAIRGLKVTSLYEAQEVDEPVAFGVLSFAVEPLLRGVGGAWEDWSEEGDL
ncbi:MAG: prepilin-type N-terminal cleavage/methylation domain-containing protein, partial [Verrucomicrobiales bacterium]